MSELVSVIIPAYNHEKYIGKCIDSVLNQTYKDLEIIVADDCSTDKTAEIINSYDDKRLIKILSKTNKGVVSTINELMKKCTGEYIAIIGSDDVWYPTKIEEQLKVFKAHPNLGAVFTDIDVIDENDEKYKSNDLNTNIFRTDNPSRGKRFRMFYEYGNYLCHSSSMIRKKVINSIGYYNKAYRQLHDYEYWVRLLTKYDFYIINKKLMAYRRANQNTSSISSQNNSNDIRMFNELFYINYKMIRDLDLDILKDGFKDLFRNKDSSTTEELLCEKYFLLLNMNYGCSNENYAYSLIFENENSDEIFNVLEAKFNYKLTDFYKDTGKVNRIYPEYLINQGTIKRIKRKLVYLTDKIHNKKQK